MSSKTQSQTEAESLKSILIAVMGSTGAGKSSVVNLLSGDSQPTNHGLKSCTFKVTEANPFKLFGKEITLIDTPGFDDTNMSDTDVLKEIALYLTSNYEAGVKLSGIIYMHRIIDVRVGGAAVRNFRMFRELCGNDSLKNVIFVTSMWDMVSLEMGEARELELKNDEQMFKSALSKGAKMLRHNNTLKSAQDILSHIVNNVPKDFRLPVEIVEEGKDITETAAGLELGRAIAEMRLKYERELQEVQEDMQAALDAQQEESRQELEEQRHLLKKSIAKLETDRSRLSDEFARERKRAEERFLEQQRSHEAERKRAERLSQAEREKERKRADKVCKDMERKMEDSLSEQSRLHQEQIAKVMEETRDKVDANNELEKKFMRLAEELAKERETTRLTQQAYDEKIREMQRLVEERERQAKEEENKDGFDKFFKIAGSVLGAVLPVLFFL